ncbi:glycosyltransferase [Paenibacillus eucommiae]|uniref:Glycosyltransferase involved in cell wall biosynthesis n=1 Tax=Paenibacillus eucommiae TaxID=1355755 RepID=A0ABS4IS32_9BACL|nr:glycosyltransferase [Paenibacillus eucommiae]MBP1990378.1 glycosyltransferase involved in cell wall biosynthesis [Paenibacillus eucommiae]
MKRRILIVIDSLHSGGAEKSLVSLLSLFDFEKYDVDLLMFSAKGLYLPLVPHEVNKLSIQNYSIVRISELIKKRKFKDMCIRLSLSIALRNPYKRNRMHTAQISWNWISKGIHKVNDKYDIAIAYSQGTPTYYVAEKVDADKKICWVNTDYKLAGYNKSFDRKYYEQFNKVIAVSDYNKEVFVSEMPAAQMKMGVIYDIVSPSLIKSMALQEGGFDDRFDGLRILTIGRLVEAKGYDMAIEACYKLKQQGYKFKWYVIGEGSLKGKMERTIKELKLEDTFILLGTFQNPYVFLKQSDIYVQPSRFEGYGLAIAEARILQKPIVATNFTVIHNQIRHGENGLIVNMNSEDIGDGIKRLIDDKDLKESICFKLSQEIIGTEKEIHKVYSIIESNELETVN